MKTQDELIEHLGAVLTGVQLDKEHAEQLKLMVWPILAQADVLENKSAFKVFISADDFD